MFDEYFEPSTIDQPVPPDLAVHILVNPPCPSVSISVDHDAPSESHSPSSSDHQSLFVHHGVAADHSLEVNPFAPADNDPFVNMFAPDTSSKELVPPPDYAMIIALKWIYKVKLDECGDVLKKTAFLNGELKEKVYVSQPEGFVDLDHPNHIYRLKKALLGLKKAPRACQPEGFVDPDHPNHVYRLKKALLGLKKAPRACRPDLVFAVCMCARYQSKPTKNHLEVVKRVFWYLQRTINMGLCYPKDNAMALTAYADADHAGCQDT
nr:retrovirus-related Pol polyprotein from transposon TNT 1-94 [Tanacetum cinerariifolium]